MSQPPAVDPSPPEKLRRAEKRSKRIYLYWSIALGLLLVLGLVCWLVVVPVWEVRRVLAAMERRDNIEKLIENENAYMASEIKRLGGPRAAYRKLLLYMRLPKRLAPHRALAVCTLLYCGERAVPDVLAYLAEDGDELVRVVAALGLKLHRSRDVVAALVKALDDPSEKVRGCAAIALGEIGSPSKRAVPKLEKLAEDGDKHVRAAAREALEKIRGQEDKPRIFRMLTLNVKKGTPAREIAAELAKANADIICLQELDQGTNRSGREDQIALLKKALGMNGAYLPSYKADGGTTGMAVLSRYPVEAPLPIKLKNSRDIGIQAAVKTPRGEVTVFSVHLSSTYKVNLKHIAETKAMRRRETARLIGLVEETRGPVILAGDFNCALDPDLIPRFTEKLTDATGQVKATYPAAVPLTKIDYVLVRGLRPGKSQVMPQGVSDHRAVLCELGFPD